MKVETSISGGSPPEKTRELSMDSVITSAARMASSTSRPVVVTIRWRVLVSSRLLGEAQASRLAATMRVRGSVSFMWGLVFCDELAGFRD